jgi:hypothetical protein
MILMRKEQFLNISRNEGLLEHRVGVRGSSQRYCVNNIVTIEIIEFKDHSDMRDSFHQAY